MHSKGPSSSLSHSCLLQISSVLLVPLLKLSEKWDKIKIVVVNQFQRSKRSSKNAKELYSNKSMVAVPLKVHDAKWDNIAL